MDMKIKLHFVNLVTRISEILHDQTQYVVDTSLDMLWIRVG